MKEVFYDFVVLVVFGAMITLCLAIAELVVNLFVDDDPEQYR